MLFRSTRICIRTVKRFVTRVIHLNNVQCLQHIQHGADYVQEPCRDSYSGPLIALMLEGNSNFTVKEYDTINFGTATDSLADLLHSVDLSVKTGRRGSIRIDVADSFFNHQARQRDLYDLAQKCCAVHSTPTFRYGASPGFSRFDWALDEDTGHQILSFLRKQEGFGKTLFAIETSIWEDEASNSLVVAAESGEPSTRTKWQAIVDHLLSQYGTSVTGIVPRDSFSVWVNIDEAHLPSDPREVMSNLQFFAYDCRKRSGFDLMVRKIYKNAMVAYNLAVPTRVFSRVRRTKTNALDIPDNETEVVVTAPHTPAELSASI